jgi:CHRD domain
MKKLVLVGTVALIAVVTVAMASQASSGQSSVRADLNGYQEDPSVSTTGGGDFTAEIDDEQQLITYELSYSALEGGATLFAHIHFGSFDHNGGVSAFLCGGGDKPACPNVEGTVTGVIDAADVIGPAGQGIEAGSFEELVRAIRVGHTYANVHTTRWPGGEIRGQIANEGQREFTG